ncbi:MAG: phospho-N-acetylmuramoyl-pentapeptide-transferase [Fibrobacteria bacterium]|nr:phospho-N-acetylmuramoyl-pentapeptide-transferase [Fibrobacteria bacterium]
MLAELLFDFTRLSVFQDRLFRAGAASLFSAAVVLFVMPMLIRFSVRINASSDFQSTDKHPPSILGGFLLIPVVIISSLAFAKWNAEVMAILVIMFAFFCVGAIDDIAKIWNKRKVIKGVISKKDYQDKADGISARLRLVLYFIFSLAVAIFAYKFIPGMTGHLTIPFIKPEIWYPYLPNWAFIILISMVITSTANGANFTDGLDSLVSIPIITTSLFAGFVAYISGNAVFAHYFLIPYLPGIDELFPLCASIAGAVGAYLWYNSPPAQIYLGDSGSIGFGAAIGMMFILIKAELFLPIVGFVFLSEAVSVFFQMGWFKITKALSPDKRGRRLFLKAPLHHTFQIMWKDRFNSSAEVNSKIIWRFHLISVFSLILGTLIFFKIR